MGMGRIVGFENYIYKPFYTAFFVGGQIVSREEYFECYWAR
jgi:hypothetical protein